MKASHLAVLAVLALLASACGQLTTELVPDAAGSGCTLKQNAQACSADTECCSGVCSAQVCASGVTGPGFGPGSLIIPMDLSYQSTGMFQAYGLIYQLLHQGIHVYWIIDPGKTWHAAPCNTPGDTCAWDCEIEGSGAKCAYPTASPDLFATTKVIWDDAGAVARGAALGRHGYRGGPFLIDAGDRDRALVIIDAWNNPGAWVANPWAKRTVFHVVSVHEATAAFTGTVAKTMVAAPTIAVFADGNEPIATGYLRAAGIPQTSGAEFPSAKCGATNCGPGTANPDMLVEEAIMGDLGTCAAPNHDHRNGALFDSAGNPRFCQIMSMHWDVTNRERVDCDGKACPASADQCTGQKITYNGHEVVAEVREFLQHSTHFFAECQAVNAYENTTPDPDWPFLDDPGRDGHFLTTPGTPPLCPAGTCTNANYQCVASACNGQACCLPKPQTWQNLPGYEVATQPASNTLKVLRPDVPYNQFDGAFGTTGGSEPAYNLSSYLGATYKNDQLVTLLTGPDGPGDQDLWMSGYLDGCGDIIERGGVQRAGGCMGKISYLGGHQYKTDVPVTSGSQSQGTRLFLNALFEANCVTGDAGPGFGDSDGDGVADNQDPEPGDPKLCGDSDGDHCDDCASGHFDLERDCGPGGPGGTGGGGCCSATGDPASALLLGALVAAALRPRRRRPRLSHR
ncbi:MAG TPA: MYXO-CTERM sorting domain-containing protein [Kofleriaceae bacterium]